MSNDEKTMKEYVEEKIERYTFHAKNFTKDDMRYVDEYCKKFYDNNRKLMILDLIRYKSENSAVILLDEKINFIYEDLYNRIQELKPREKKEEVKKREWKGFGGN